MKGISGFYNGIISELNQIKWPTREETVRLVLVVAVFSLFMAAYLGAADVTFVALIRRYILKV